MRKKISFISETYARQQTSCRKTTTATRHLWLVLAVLLLFCAAGAGTVAADTVNAGTFQDLSDAISNFSGTRTIVITNDIPVGSTFLPDIGSGKSITLTPAGNYRIYRADYGGGLFSITSGGSLTITDNGASTLTLEGYGYGSHIYSPLIYVDRGTFTMEGGTITKNTAGSGITISSYGGSTFTMSGGEITNNAGRGVSFDGPGSTFMMSGNAVIANNGGGVYILDSTFTMSGNAVITNNTGGGYVGGVYVGSSVGHRGIFTMNGGEITNNHASNGGGVNLNDATFTMNGGKISGNTAGYSGSSGDGGGVFVSDGSRFTMTGGEITYNTANYLGGGVCTYRQFSGTVDPSFTMTGGRIANNHANWEGGGVEIHVSSSFTMSGNAVITNNTAGGGGAAGLWINPSSSFTMSGNALVDATNTVVVTGGYTFIRVTTPFTGGALNITVVNPATGTKVVELPAGTPDIYQSQFILAPTTSPPWALVYNNSGSTPIYQLGPGYNVIVQNDGNGTATASSTFAAAGSTITLTATPTTPGYILKEWQVVSGGVTVTGNTFIMPNNAVTVKAIFGLPTYNVTVQTVAGGGGSASPSTGVSGTLVTLTAAPNTGYDHTGWQVVSGGVTVSGNTFSMPTSDVTVRPVFAQHIYNVTVQNDTYGTGTAAPSAGVSGTVITLSASPNNGYTLAGWEVVSGGISVNNNTGTFSMPTSDVIVKPVFTQSTYTVTVNPGVNGNGTSSPAGGTAGTLITLIPAPDYGYVTLGWEIVTGTFTINNNTGTFSMPSENVIVRPVFTLGTYNISILPGTNGNGTASPNGGIMGTPITLTPQPDPGYVIAGWEVVTGNASINNATGTFSMPGEDISIRPVFTLGTYTVTVNPGVNGNGTASPSAANINDLITLVPAPDYGYVIDGWEVVTGNASISNSTNSFSMPGENVTVKPVFTLGSYNISILPGTNGNGTASPTGGTIGTPITLTPHPDYGYVIAGWEVVTGNNVSINNGTGTFSMPGENVTVRPVFTQGTYTTTILPGTNGNGTASPPSASAGTSVTLTPQPDYGYVIDGWEVVTGNVSINNSTGTFTMPDENISIRPVFVQGTYTVTVDQGINGNGTASPTGGNIGTPITLTPQPDYGYVADGWEIVTGNNFTINNATGTFTMPGENVTVRPVFTQGTYTTTILPGTNGNGTASPPSASAGTSVTLTPQPDYGYVIDGWEVVTGNASINNSTGTFTMPGEDISIRPVFVQGTYTVTVDPGVNGNGTATPNGGAMNTPITLTPQPDYGYVINGWEVVTGNNVSINNATGTFSMPGENVTVRPVFTQGTYTTTILPGTNGNGTASPPSASAGTSVTLTPQPDYGYVIDGWEVVTGNASINNSTGTFTMPDENISIRPVFKQGTYNTSILPGVNGNGTASPNNGTPGTTIHLNSTPDYGYVADGWEVVTGNNVTIDNATGTFVMPGEDISIRPVFTLGTYTVTVNPGTGGNGAASPSAGSMSDLITLTPQPDYGYISDGWEIVTGNNFTISNATGTFSMPGENVTVKPVFTLGTYNTSILPGVNGNGTASPNNGTPGTTIHLNSTPDYGYIPDGWEVVTGNNVTIDNDTGTFVMPGEDISIRPVFTLGTYTVTVDPGVNGNGTASPSAGSMSDQITLHPHPDYGYIPDGWEVVSGSNFTISNITGTFSMPGENVTVRPVFVQGIYNVIVLNDGHGSANASHASAFARDVITLSATPNSGYDFREWRITSGNGTISGNTLTLHDSDVTVLAVFAARATPAPTSGSGGGNTANSYRVLFETSGGSYVPPITGLSAGDRISAPVSPTKDGYTFGGWYKEEACVNAWVFASDTIPGDMTLYAKWNGGMTPTPTMTVTPTISPTVTATMSPTVTATVTTTTSPTVDTTGDQNQPDGASDGWGILEILLLIALVLVVIFLILFFLLRHTVTFLVATAEGVEKHRVKVWHGKKIDAQDLPGYIRTASWYADEERRERWDVVNERVTKSIRLYSGNR